jgi:hypothetical protein
MDPLAKKSLVEVELDRCWPWQRLTLLKMAIEEKKMAEARAIEEKKMAEARAIEEKKMTEARALQEAKLAREHPKAFSPDWWEDNWSSAPRTLAVLVTAAVVTQVAGAPVWARYISTCGAAFYARGNSRTLTCI